MVRGPNYYDILGVATDADTRQIKEAYIFKVNIYHPDRLSSMSERIRIKAEQELIRINEAFEILSKPGLKKEYDSKLFGRQSHFQQSTSSTPSSSGPPQPVIYPNIIKLDNGVPHQKYRASIFLKNSGGAFKKLSVSHLPNWLRITGTKRLRKPGKLPLRFDLEAKGKEWGRTYQSDLIINLDKSSVTARVKLNMSDKPPGGIGLIKIIGFILGFLVMVIVIMSIVRLVST